jgi:hypothetical protein
MVNTLAAMHNLTGKQINFTQAFPRAKLKEDIYLRFPAGFEHKNKNGHSNLDATYTDSYKHPATGFSNSAQYMRDSDSNNQNLIHVCTSEKT